MILPSNSPRASGVSVSPPLNKVGFIFWRVRNRPGTLKVINVQKLTNADLEAMPDDGSRYG